MMNCLGGVTLAGLVARIHGELGVPVMADTSCIEDARFAQAAGGAITRPQAITRRFVQAISG